MKFDILQLVGYHEKWHGQIQDKRPITKYSINEKIIDYIFDKINIDEGSFVEFGAWDGKINSNARNLFRKGWKGLFIESDGDRFNQLSLNYKSKKNIYLSSSHIDFEKNKLDNEIEKSLNNPIDFMSIDIDGLDLEIFKTIQKFFPTVLCIEGGQVLEPYQNIVNNKIAKQNVQQSLYQMNKIIEERGYKLICAYQDAFFILEHKFHLLNINQKDIFFHYVDGLLAYPRIPYLYILLNTINIQNRVINYILKPIDKTTVMYVGKHGSISEKSNWVNKNYSLIQSRLNNLIKLRMEFPYNEYDETLWEKV